MTIETPQTARKVHAIDHRHPIWLAVIAKAVHAIPFIQDEENNLRCARSMQLGHHEPLIELPVPSIADPSLEVSIAHVQRLDTPHIDEPSIILEWESPGVDELPQKEYIAVAVARLIGNQIELQNTFDRRDYNLVEQTLEATASRTRLKPDTITVC